MKKVRVKFWVDEKEAEVTVEVPHDADVKEEIEGDFDNWMNSVSCGYEILSEIEE